MRKQITEGDIPFCGNSSIGSISFIEFIQHYLVFELGNIITNRLIQQKFTLFIKYHDAHTGYCLGLAHDPEDGIGSHWFGLSRIGITISFTLDQYIILYDESYYSLFPVFLNIIIYQAVYSRQFFIIHSGIAQTGGLVNYLSERYRY